ncbi:MAG: TPM domain-containing protein [Candidatus Omnitrophota bacterium]
MIKKIVIILAVLFISGSFNLVSCDDTEYPKHIGYVNDYAGILSEHTESLITSFAAQLEAATTAQIALVTVPTVKPSTIEGYAVELFENWGIGQRDKDNMVSFS